MGETPLFEAVARTNNRDAIEFLVGVGADINASNRVRYNTFLYAYDVEINTVSCVNLVAAHAAWRLEPRRES